LAEAALYTVADERYFLGLVGLVNSLRLVGHDEPIRVLDCGLNEPQRKLLEPVAALTRDTSGEPPWLLKTILPLEDSAPVVALLDADMIATASLAPLLERAAADRLVAFRNVDDRFVAGWGEALGAGPPRRGDYLSSAALFGALSAVGDLLGELRDRRDLVDFERTHWRANDLDYPFLFADQDVLNALLATEPGGREVEALDPRLAPTPPFAGLSVRDAATLDCAYEDGTGPFLIHHHVVKPWLERTHDGVYSQLLRRLLSADDVAVKVPAEMIPPWLRSGPRGGAERLAINARERMRARGRA
jgi:hypothetical protein